MRSTVCPAGAPRPPRPPSGCCADNVATRPSNVTINNDCLMRIFTSADGSGRRFAGVKSPNSLSRYVREATAGDENRVELPGVADVVERIGFQHDEIGPLPRLQRAESLFELHDPRI